MSTVNAFYAHPGNANLFKQEYGFYWERSVRDDKTGHVVKTEEWNMDERKEAAKKGQAMSDGSFPIKNSSDLHNAISDWGRAGAKPSVKAHICERAKSMDCSHLLPEGWGKPSNQDSNTDSTAK